TMGHLGPHLRPIALIYNDCPSSPGPTYLIDNGLSELLWKAGLFQNLVGHVSRHDLNKHGEGFARAIAPHVVVALAMSHECAPGLVQLVAHQLAVALHAVARTLVWA